MSPTKSSAAGVTTGQQLGATGNNCHESPVRLEIIELTYSDHQIINNDTIITFPAPEWKKGRLADPDKSKQFPEQFPVAYVRKTKIKFKEVKFRVVQKPTCDEEVWIKGQAMILRGIFMQWVTKVKIGSTQDEVILNDLISDVELPDFITYYDPFGIEWFSNTGTSYKTRRTAGVSKNPLYVLLGAPSAVVAYWTLVDVSCRAANGKATDNDAVPAIYIPFKGAQAKPPVPIKRKRDGMGLKYWNPETDEVFKTADLLANPRGSGRCGAWSLFMVDMCRVHGITSAQQIKIDDVPDNIGLLVKNWAFTKSPDIVPSYHAGSIDFTHFVGSKMGATVHMIPLQAVTSGGGCTDLSGIAAQGNSEPMPAFFDHAIVNHNGIFYDPSYGTHENTSELDWEQHALDGVFSGASTSSSSGVVAVAARHPGFQVFTFTVQ